MNSPATSFAQAKPLEAILVLGTHRSGTSALTRVINLLGADLPLDLMPPTPGNNELGFWEAPDAWHMNDEILASLGSRWDDWHPIAPGPLDAVAKGPFKNRALRNAPAKLSQVELLCVEGPTQLPSAAFLDTGPG